MRHGSIGYSPAYPFPTSSSCSTSKNPSLRTFYELHCLKERWIVCDLQRQQNRMLFERMELSHDREAVLALSREGRLGERPETVLRDPYIRGLQPPPGLQEKQQETALINPPERFMLELGRDFCFMARQFRITVGNRYHEDHDGFDGVMLGRGGLDYHFKFTQHRGHLTGNATSPEHLLVFYLPDEAEWQQACERVAWAGFRSVPAHNPSWDRRGRTCADLEGYRVVLQNASWEA